MSALRLTDVSFAFRDDVPLLAGVTLHLSPGWTALVGPNGAGKTTLLRLLAGELRPGTGTRAGPASVHVCPQQIGPVDDAVRGFAWGWTGDEAWALQSSLGLDPADLDRWETLSWGERKRWQVGAALAARPEVLLLDEPTNHLDVAARAQIGAALKAFPGIGVLVSHDRELLRALADAVVRVERGRAELFPGGWDDAQAQWALDRSEVKRRIDVASAEVKASRARLTVARARQEASTRSRDVKSRMKNLHDQDATSMARKFRAEQAETTHGRQVDVDRRRAASAQATRDALEVPRELGGDVRFASEPSPRRRLLARTGALAVGERTIGVDLTLDRGEHVWLRGPNGAGKSTLLRALLAEADLPPERVLVLPQELPDGDGLAALAELADLTPGVRGRVLQAVALLGVDPAALLASASPSPGEARKLRVALGLGRGVWLLALDEPSNHLDLPSVERLERALRGFEGAVLLVTHDGELGRAVAGRVWSVERERVVEEPLAVGR